jgi:hypothetical protein
LSNDPAFGNRTVAQVAEAVEWNLDQPAGEELSAISAGTAGVGDDTLVSQQYLDTTPTSFSALLLARMYAEILSMDQST